MNIQRTLEQAVEHHRAGAYTAAAPLYRQVLGVDPAAAQALHLLGMCRLRSGDGTNGLIDIGRARRLDGNLPGLAQNGAVAVSEIWQQAAEQMERGDFAAAAAALRAILAWRDDLAAVRGQLADCLAAAGRKMEAFACLHALLDEQPMSLEIGKKLLDLMLPGDNYYAILESLHRWLTPRAYLEIGVADGRSLSLVRPPTVAVGIDPIADQVRRGFSARTKLFATTSDAFFADHDVPAVLESDRIDFAFIDGLHHFDQIVKDFANVERLSRPDTVVVLHDTIPLSAFTAEREATGGFWTGDCWKAGVMLRRYRPDLAMMTIPTPPSGLLLITNLDPASTVLNQRFEEIVADGFALPFRHFWGHYETELGLIANDWPTIEAAVRAAWSSHDRAACRTG